MRVLIQRVKRASVLVDQKQVASIGKGLLLLVGLGKQDREEQFQRAAKKIVQLRVFEDENRKMNLNVMQTGGEILSVPQFTLYADLRKGNRPGFEEAELPELAEKSWKRFNELLCQTGLSVKEGVFSAHMAVELVNDGPVTIWIDTELL